MSLEIRQQLKLSQQLIMTPQLQQAIKLLQLSRAELAEVVQKELESNPVLEEGQDPVEDRELDDKEIEEVQEEPAPQEEFVDPEKDGNQPIDWQTYFGDYNSEGSLEEFSDNEEAPYYENVLTKKTSLADHLLNQIRLSKITDEDRVIAAEIIGNIDEKGYLQATLEEIAAATHAPVEAVENVLRMVQELDPPGVGSRNLRECLLRQMESRNMDNPVARAILENHFEDLENRKYPQIAKALDISVENVHEAIKVIASLEPFPGRAFSQEDTHYIIPDIFVYKVEDDYVVMLNDDGLPNLRINSFYRDALAKGKEIDAEIGEYIQEKMRSALWLIKSIQQRQRTIYKVTRSIVKFQRDFFDYGIEYLKPMVLRDIAEDIQMHESTISRVPTNKYVQTPRGTFELKYFFNGSINTTDGNSVASESVKNKIEEIVASEDARKPYSDQKIVELLKENGIEIARRTVTKYREMLNIGSSTERKRYF